MGSKEEQPPDERRRDMWHILIGRGKPTGYYTEKLPDGRLLHFIECNSWAELWRIRRKLAPNKARTELGDGLNLENLLD